MYHKSRKPFGFLSSASLYISLTARHLPLSAKEKTTPTRLDFCQTLQAKFWRMYVNRTWPPNRQYVVEKSSESFCRKDPQKKKRKKRPNMISAHVFQTCRVSPVRKKARLRPLVLASIRAAIKWHKTHPTHPETLETWTLTPHLSLTLHSGTEATEAQRESQRPRRRMWSGSRTLKELHTTNSRVLVNRPP